jgi:hypothetical protein
LAASAVLPAKKSESAATRVGFVFLPQVFGLFMVLQFSGEWFCHSFQRFRIRRCCSLAATEELGGGYKIIWPSSVAF